MALKTNTKKAKENLRRYVVDHYDADGYDADTPEAKAVTFEEIAAVIRADVKRVRGWMVEKYDRYTWADAFREWVRDMPGLFDSLYMLGGRALDDLAELLEETEEEKNRYTAEQAEEMLTRLLFREIWGC